jgi:XTP/dITP diphosphohydrolase
MDRLPITELVIASHNAGKAREIAALLAPYDIKTISTGELGLPEPEETGKTFVENAVIKAQAAAERSGLVALADDSGLSVAALGGAPGIRSARWAGAARDFRAAMERVERELGKAADRSASFVCCLCLAWPDGEYRCFEGRCDGTLVWPPRGDHGFGYDPIFQPRGHGETFGEMAPEEKHAISHRTRAFEKFAAYLLPAA